MNMNGKKSNQKEVKSVRFDSIHLEILEDLTPFYGSNKGEVIRNIVMMWIHDNLGSETIKELQKNGAIKLGSKKELDS